MQQLSWQFSFAQVLVGRPSLVTANPTLPGHPAPLLAWGGTGGLVPFPVVVPHVLRHRRTVALLSVPLCTLTVNVGPVRPA